jgi:hypothetical protein
MSNEEVTEEIIVNAEDGELTEEQALAVENLQKLFNVKVRAALVAILDGVSAKYTRKQSKIKKRKNGTATRYEQGWLDATEELFDGVYSFLYALEEATVAASSAEVEIADDNFDIFEAMSNVNNEGETNEKN